MKRLLILLPLFLAACSPAPKPAAPARDLATPEPFVPVEGQPSANDIARFLAGRPVHRGAVLSQWQQIGNYRDHSTEMAMRWRVFGSNRTGKQRVWAEENLRPLIGTPRTLLYPFGGPDLLHAVALFPQASNYVLLGLEPAGGLPDLESADPGQVLAALSGLRKSTETQLRHGYFITKDMKNDLSGGPMPGVTPILLATLSLMDATVDDVRPLDAAGRPGVDIRFRLPGGGARRAIYVSGDLSNRGFNDSFRSWLSSYSGSVAYFKAASYLMHDSHFSGTRDWILGNCRAVVQDDSGIPFRYYTSSNWDVRLFGNYEAPIGLFEKHLQTDLREAYRSPGIIPPVPFGSGYHLRAEQANLQVATRR